MKFSVKLFLFFVFFSLICFSIFYQRPEQRECEFKSYQEEPEAWFFICLKYPRTEDSTVILKEKLTMEQVGLACDGDVRWRELNAWCEEYFRFQETDHWSPKGEVW